MTRLLGAELLKLRTTRTAAALAGASVSLALAFLLLSILTSDPGPGVDPLETIDIDTANLFMPIGAIVAVTGEYRHGTIASTMLAAPRRRRQVAAQAIAYAAAGVALSVGTWVVLLGVGLPLLDAEGFAAPAAGATASLIARETLGVALLGVLGVGVGALVTNQAAALVGTLGVLLFVEPTLAALVDWTDGYGPASGAASLGALNDDSLPAPLVGGLVLGAWAAALLVAGLQATERRDIG